MFRLESLGWKTKKRQEGEGASFFFSTSSLPPIWQKHFFSQTRKKGVGG